MKFFFFLSPLALLNAAHASVKSNGGARAGTPTMQQHIQKLKLKQDFMRAMHADGKIAGAKRKQHEAQRKRKLIDKLMATATPRKLDEQYNAEYAFEDYEWMNPIYKQMIEDGAFDLTARSFKYSGCSAIKAFDPGRATQNGNPMVIDTYAVFRLCPEESCNKYSLTGCGKNYGEYVVEMSTYLQFMLEFYESHYGAYCEYCFPCDYTYQVMKRQTQGTCYENINKNEYESKQSQQQMAWEDYYQQNFGDMSEYNRAKQEYQEEMKQQMENTYQEVQQQQWSQGSVNNNNAYSNGGNRKLDGGYYSSYVGAYENGGDSSSQASSYNDDTNDDANDVSNDDANVNNNIYSNFVNYKNGGGNNNNNGANAGNSNANGWANGGQANGQAYYNMMNQQYNNNGRHQYGYYNEYGNYVDLCEGDGYTDNDGREYDVDCDAYESKMMMCSDGSLCDQCEYQVDQQYLPCDEYVCKDYYTYCSDLYEPQYKQMYNQDENGNYQNGDNQNGNNQEQYYKQLYAYNNPYYYDPNQAAQVYSQEWYFNSYGNGNSYYGQKNNANDYNNYNYNEEQEQNRLYDFLACTQHIDEYGQEYFVGPHCGSDHYTITLGVFADENCVEYLGESVSLSKVLGYGYDEESFFHLPHECISCDGASQFADDEERYQEMFTGQGLYGQYVEAPNEEFDDVVAMCAALFERSAQCNIHMQNYDMMSRYMEDLDSEFEKRYCGFIDNIVYDSYDESGEIKLRADNFDLSDWRNPKQYKKLKMPAGQAIGLALSILLVIALAALAFVTQRSLTRGSTPWKPKRPSNMEPSSMNRQDSGIVMGRSCSGGPVTPPLI